MSLVWEPREKSKWVKGFFEVRVLLHVVKHLNSSTEVILLGTVTERLRQHVCRVPDQFPVYRVESALLDCLQLQVLEHTFLLD